MSPKIYFMAAYQEMFVLANMLLRYYDDIEVILRHNSIDERVREAIELERQGKAEVFIVRGATTISLLKQMGIKSPIVEIPITVYDLLSAVKEASLIHRKIGVVGLPSVVRAVKAIEPIMGIKIETFDKKIVEDGLEQITKMGIEVLVGGFVSCRAASSKGIPSILVKTGKEAIIKACEEARRIADVKRKEEAKIKQIQAILECANEGIITADNKGIVTICNPAAERIAETNSVEIIGKPVENFISGDTIKKVLKSKKAILGDLQRINHAQVLTNNVPIMVNSEIVGVVSTFKDVTKIQEYEENIRRSLRPKEHTVRYSFNHIIGNSKDLKAAKEKAYRYSLVDSNLLLQGETGVGKEMFAQAIHSNSDRREGPFIAINCAALPAALLESELFGYEEGAFTGAKKGGKIGLFTIAHGGTIFLDEVSEISVSLQTKLLRVLQEKVVRPVGGSREISIDVRVVSASNKDLKKAIEEGKFRNDLYYRLNVLNIRIPPLRERQEDIPQLIEFFSKKYKKDRKKEYNFSSEALQYLSSELWPGNVRELQNLVERIMILADESHMVINIDDVKKAMIEDEQYKDFKDNTDSQLLLSGSLKDMEKQIILSTLRKERGSQSKTAKRLNISRTLVWHILKEQEIEGEESDK